MEKALLQFSGGLDSTVAGFFLKASGMKIHALYFDVGKENQKEVAKLLAEKYFQELTIIDISDIFKNLTSLNMKYIPGYRMIMNTISLSFCEKLGLHRIYTGEMPYSDDPNGEEHFGEFLIGDRNFADYQDCAPFRRDLAELFTRYSSGVEQTLPQTSNYFMFVDPFLGMSKSNLIHIGASLGVPFERTLSCQELSRSFFTENHPWTHCGSPSCYFCVERQKAFRAAEIVDPTEYYAKGM